MRCAVKLTSRLLAVRAFRHSLVWLAVLISAGPSSAHDKPAVPAIPIAPSGQHDKKEQAPMPVEVLPAVKTERRLEAEKMRRHTGNYCFLPTDQDPRGLGLKPNEAEKKNLDCADKILKDAYFNNAFTPASNNGNALYNLPKTDQCSLKRILDLPDHFKVADDKETDVKTIDHKIAALVGDAMKKLEKSPREQDNLAFCYWISEHRNPTEVEKKSNEYKFELQMEAALDAHRLKNRDLKDFNSMYMLSLNQTFKDKVAPKSLSCEEGKHSTAFEAYFYRELYLDTKWDEQNEIWRKANPDLAQKLRWTWEKRYFIKGMRYRLCDLAEKEPTLAARLSKAVAHYSQPTGVVPLWVSDILLHKAEGMDDDSDRDRLLTFFEEGYVTEFKRGEAIRGIIDGCPAAKAALASAQKKDFEKVLAKIGPRWILNEEKEIGGQPIWLARNQEAVPVPTPLSQDAKDRLDAEKKKNLATANNRRVEIEEFLQKSMVAANVTAALINRKFIPCGGAEDATAQEFFAKFLPKLSETPTSRLLNLFEEIRSAATRPETHDFLPNSLQFRVKASPEKIEPYCLFTGQNEPRLFPARSKFTNRVEVNALLTKINLVEAFIFPHLYPGPTDNPNKRKDPQLNAIERSFLWSASGRIGKLDPTPIKAEEHTGLFRSLLNGITDHANIAWDRIFADTPAAEKAREVIFLFDKVKAVGAVDYETVLLKAIKDSPAPAVSAAIVREFYLKEMEKLQAQRAVGPSKVLAGLEQKSFAKLRLELCEKLRADSPRAIEDFKQLQRFVASVNRVNPQNYAQGDLSEDRMRFFLSLEPAIRDKVNAILETPCSTKYPELRTKLFHSLVGGDVASFSDIDAKGAWIGQLERYETVCKIVSEMEKRVPGNPADLKEFEANFRGDGELLKLLLKFSIAEARELLGLIEKTPVGFGKLVIKGEKVSVMSWEESTAKPKLELVPPVPTRLIVSTLPNETTSEIFRDKAAAHFWDIYRTVSLVPTNPQVTDPVKLVEFYSQSNSQLDALVGESWQKAYGKPFYNPAEKPLYAYQALRNKVEEAKFFLALRRFALLGVARDGSPLPPPSKELAANAELMLIRERGREMLAATKALREDLAKLSSDPNHKFNTKTEPELMLRGIIQEQERWGEVIERLKGEVAAGKLKQSLLREATEAFHNASGEIEKMLVKHISALKPLPGPLSYQEIDSVNLRFPRGTNNITFAFELINVPLGTISKHGKLSDAVFEYMNSQNSCGADAIFKYSNPKDAAYYFKNDIEYISGGERDEEKRSRLPKWICWAATICAPLGGQHNVDRMNKCREGAEGVQAIRDYIDKQAEVYARHPSVPANDQLRATELVRRMVDYKVGGSWRNDVIAELTKLKKSDKAEDRAVFAMVASVMLRLPAAMGSDIFITRLMAPSRFTYGLDEQEQAWKREEEAAYRDRFPAVDLKLYDRYDDPRNALLDPFNLKRDGRLGFGGAINCLDGRCRDQPWQRALNLNLQGFTAPKKGELIPRLKIGRGADGGLTFDGGGVKVLTQDELDNLFGKSDEPKDGMGPHLPGGFRGRTRLVLPGDFDGGNEKPGTAPGGDRILPVILRGANGKIFTLPRRLPNGDPLKAGGVGDIDPALLVPLDLGGNDPFDRFRVGGAGAKWDPLTLALGGPKHELPLTKEEIKEFRELLLQAPQAWLQHHWARELADVPTKRTLRQELTDLREAVMVARTMVDNTPVPNVPEKLPVTPPLATLENAHVDFLKTIVNGLDDARGLGNWNFGKVNALKLPMADLENKFKRAEVLGGESLVLQEVRNLIEDQRAYLRIAARSNYRSPVCFHKMFISLTNVKSIGPGYTCVDTNKLTASEVKNAEELEKALAVISERIRAQLTRGEAAVGRGSNEFTDFVRFMVGPEQELAAREQRIYYGREQEKAVVDYGNKWAEPKKRQTLATIPGYRVEEGKYLWSADKDIALMPSWIKMNGDRFGPKTEPEDGDRLYYGSSGAFGPWAGRLNEEMSRVDITRAIREALVKKGEFDHMLRTRQEGDGQGGTEQGKKIRKVFEDRWNRVPAYKGLSPDSAAAWNSYPPYMRELLMRALERPDPSKIPAHLTERVMYPIDRSTRFDLAVSPKDVLVMDPTDLQEWVGEPWPGRVLGLGRLKHSQERYESFSTRGRRLPPPLLPTACDRFLEAAKANGFNKGGNATYAEITALLQAKAGVLCGKVDDPKQREAARAEAIRLLRKVYADNDLIKTAAAVSAADWARVPQSEKVAALRLGLAQQTKLERDFFAGKMFSDLADPELAKQLLSFIIQTVEDWGNDLTGAKAAALELAKGGMDRFSPIHAAVLGTIEQTEGEKNAAAYAELTGFVDKVAAADREILAENAAHDAKQNERLKDKANDDERWKDRLWLMRDGYDSSWLNPKHPDGYSARLGASLSSAQRLAILGQDKRSQDILAGVWDYIANHSPTPSERPKRQRELITSIQMSPDRNGLHWAGLHDPNGTVLKKLGEAAVLAHDQKSKQIMRDLYDGKSPTVDQLGFITKEVSDQWKGREMGRRLQAAQALAVFTGTEVPVALVSDADLLEDKTLLPRLIEDYINNRKMQVSKEEFEKRISTWLVGEPPPREQKVRDLSAAIKAFAYTADTGDFVRELPPWIVAAGGFKDAAGAVNWFNNLHGLMVPTLSQDRVGLQGSVAKKTLTDRTAVGHLFDQWMLTQALSTHGGNPGVKLPQSRPPAIDPKDPERQLAAADVKPLPDIATHLKECEELGLAALRSLPEGWAGQVEKGKVAEREMFAKREAFRQISRDVRVLKQKLAFIARQIPNVDDNLEKAYNEGSCPTGRRRGNKVKDKHPSFLPDEACTKLETKLANLKKLKELTTVTLNTMERKAEAMLAALQDETKPDPTRKPVAMLDGQAYYDKLIPEVMNNCMEGYSKARLDHAIARGLPPFEEKKFRAQEREYFSRQLAAREALRRFAQRELQAGRPLAGVPDTIKKFYSDLTGNRFPDDVDHLSKMWADISERAKAIHGYSADIFELPNKYGLTEAALRRQPPDFTGFKVPSGEVVTMHDLKEMFARITRQLAAEDTGYYIPMDEWKKHPFADRLYNAFQQHVVGTWIQASTPTTFAMNKEVAVHVEPVSQANGGDFYMEFHNLTDMKNTAKDLIKEAKNITDNNEWFLDLRASQNHTVDLVAWALSKTNPIGWIWGESLEQTDVTGHKGSAKKNVDDRIGKLIEARNKLAAMDGLQLEWDGGEMSGLAIATHLDVEKETGIRDQLIQTLADAQEDRKWQMITGGAYLAAIVATAALTIVTAGAASPLMAALIAAGHGAITAGTLHYITEVTHDAGYVSGRWSGDIDEKSGGVKANWAYSPNHFYKDVGPEVLTSMALFAAGSFGANYIIGMAGRALMVSKAATSAGIPLAEAQQAARALRVLQSSGQAIEGTAEYAKLARLAAAAGEGVEVKAILNGLTASEFWGNAVAQRALQWQTGTNALVMYGTNVAGRTGISYVRSELEGIPFHLDETLKQNLLSELSTIAFMSGGDKFLASKVGPQIFKLPFTKRLLDLSLFSKTMFAGSINVGISRGGKFISEKWIEDPKTDERFRAIIEMMQSGDADAQARGYSEMAKFSESLTKRREEKKLEIYKDLFHAATIDIGMFGRKAALQNYRETAGARAARRIELGEPPSVAIARMRGEMQGGFLAKAASPLESTLHWVAKKPSEPGKKEAHEFENIIDVNGGAHVLVALKEASKESPEARKLYEKELELLGRRLEEVGLKTDKRMLERMLETYVKEKEFKDAPLMSPGNRKVFSNGRMVDLDYDGGMMPFHEYARKKFAAEDTARLGTSRSAIKSTDEAMDRAISLERKAWKTRLEADPDSFKDMPAVLLTHPGKVEFREHLAVAYAKSEADHPASQVTLAAAMKRYLDYVIPAKGKDFDAKKSGKDLVRDFETALINTESAVRWMRDNKVDIGTYRQIFGETEHTAHVSMLHIMQNDGMGGGRQIITYPAEFRAFFLSKWIEKSKYRSFTEKQWLDSYTSWRNEQAKKTANPPAAVVPPQPAAVAPPGGP